MAPLIEEAAIVVAGFFAEYGATAAVIAYAATTVILYGPEEFLLAKIRIALSSKARE